MINSRLAVAIHIMILIASNPRETVSSEWMAGSVNTNPVVVRRIMGMLRKAGLLTSRAGKTGAALTKDPADITLLDIFRAVEPKEELFAIHEKPNPECAVGKNIQSALDVTFGRAQTAMEQELSSQTLKDVMNHLL
ncbi:Rrf2 family transcriptional regulator [Domibacillus sp. PGB-M46]|uniref:Rrf2 family transcriptional regulator n=1 Tax=Domibacillus sp. PGB-M46 TaxID=2910255 RepID=UPI001F57EAD1|nr:Rrf2 family transcriptional regulator [Domibacillus sp. PGB-M46]MCI2255669.1 Rrf2 family transcriptional regulator [Domibacillus sp. PGB-M46]